MKNVVEHITFAVVKRENLTDELVRETDELAVRVNEETGGVLGHTVTYTNQFTADTVAVVHHWVFEDNDARERFRDGKTHAEHIKKIGPVMLDKHIFAYEHE